MSSNTLFSLLRRFAVPLMLTILGLVLVIHPDAATALISRFIGWCMTLVGIGFGIGAIAQQQNRIRNGFFALALVLAGGWLIANPLLLAAWIGRFIGAVLVVNGVMDGLYAWRQGRGFLLHIVITLVGAVLLLMPMTASRLVFTLCGIAVAVVGILMFLDRLRGRNALNPPDEPDDPNIIDAL